jgi:hypothetical protein
MNRPVIRVGVHGVVGAHATVYPPREGVRDVYLQTLDAAGTWIALSLRDVIQETQDGTDVSIRSGTFQAEERGVFDASGDAYTIVDTNVGDLLLHSREGMTSWDAYPLPTDDVLYRIEMTAAERPPVIFVFKSLPHPDNPACLNGSVSIIAPGKNADGTPTMQRMGRVIRVWRMSRSHGIRERTSSTPEQRLGVIKRGRHSTS